MHASAAGIPNLGDSTMKSMRLLSSTLAGFIFSACSAGDQLGPSPVASPMLTDSPASAVVTAASVRVRCELRVGQRSKVSVDGNNLSPLNGRWSATVRSGTNGASAPARTAVGDEVEFDFDSNPNDIRAGATAIAANFITISAGLDVTASIANSAGVVIATGGADCETR